MAPALVRAQASDLPSGPIRVILPTLHGGQADTLGRLIGDRVGPAIDRSFVMEPRAGAGGLIAGEYVARAVPDGNTLLFVTGGHTTLPGLYAKSIKFDAVKDFAFVCQITESSFAIAVATDHPAKSFAELLEMSKREPGKSNFSSTGAGSTQHLIGEVFQERFGIMDAVHYPGGARPVNDVIAGRVDMAINSMLTIAPGQRRADAGAGGVFGRTRGTAAQHAVVRGDFAGVLGRHDPGPRRSGRDAKADRRPPQPGDRQGGPGRCHPRAAGGLGNPAKAGTPEELAQTVAQMSRAGPA